MERKILSETMRKAESYFLNLPLKNKRAKHQIYIIDYEKKRKGKSQDS